MYVCVYIQYVYTHTHTHTTEDIFLYKQDLHPVLALAKYSK